MKPLIASIFISLAVWIQVEDASAFAPGQTVHIELLNGRSIAGDSLGRGDSAMRHDTTHTRAADTAQLPEFIRSDGLQL